MIPPKPSLTVSNFLLIFTSSAAGKFFYKVNSIILFICREVKDCPAAGSGNYIIIFVSDYLIIICELFKKLFFTDLSLFVWNHHLRHMYLGRKLRRCWFIVDSKSSLE